MSELGAASRLQDAPSRADEAESRVSEAESRTCDGEGSPCATEPRTWKLTLAYDGGPFFGWQVQPGLATIQGALAAAIERVTGEQVLPQGSGRTDAGVHALGQVASFALQAPIPSTNLHRALNRALPAAIRVLAAEVAAPGFHARHSARSKLYEYRIWRGEVCPPWIAPYVYACNWPLSLSAMQEAAAQVLGEHDFTSFAARQPDLATRLASLVDTKATPSGEEPSLENPQHAPGSGYDQPWDFISDHASASGCDPATAFSPIRRILTSHWDQPSPELLCYQVRGTGFLHHMVRNLVGTFLAVGRGQLASDQISSILAARDRSAAGATAPARGLFLHSVEYEGRL